MGIAQVRSADTGVVGEPAVCGDMARACELPAAGERADVGAAGATARAAVVATSNDALFRLHASSRALIATGWAESGPVRAPVAGATDSVPSTMSVPVVEGCAITGAFTACHCLGRPRTPEACGPTSHTRPP